MEKRRRRENIAKAREQARRFVLPLLILGFALLAGWLFMRFGMGKKWTPEEREKIRTQRQMMKIMRQYGGDYDKLKEVLKAAGVGDKASSSAPGEALAEDGNGPAAAVVPEAEAEADAEEVVAEEAVASAAAVDAKDEQPAQAPAEAADEVVADE